MMSLVYEKTYVDLMGMKFTMDGGADGHTLESSIDEILHNFIDFGSNDIEMFFEPDKYWSFRFNIMKEVSSPSDKINKGVTFFETKGDVAKNDVGKYGKGIKCAAHCISPQGKMILGIIINSELYIGVYDQGEMNTIKCGTESSNSLREVFIEKQGDQFNMSRDVGFMIITIDPNLDYPELFESLNFGDNFNNSDIDEGHNEEDKDKMIDTLKKHISICYSPLLNTNFEEVTQCHINNVDIKLNGETVPAFDHTNYSSEDIEDNSDIEFAKEYKVVVPYREINGIRTNVYEAMYFEDSKGNFVFNEKGKTFPPEEGEYYVTGTEDCTVRLTKLSPEAQGRYIGKNGEYNHFEKTKQCSYMVYRNGVCSETSFIPFDGEGVGEKGIRPTDAPQLRGEIFCNNTFDSVISPASNKSLIRPNKDFTRQLRSLSKYVNKELFKKYSAPTRKTIEGKEYLVMPNNTVMDKDGTKKLGQIKGGQIRWDKLSSLKQKAKKELIEKNNGVTPLLSKKVEHPSEIKESQKAEYRLYTNNPDSDNQDDVHIVSKEEYNMIVDKKIDSDIFDKTYDLEKKRKDIQLKKLKEIIETLDILKLNIVDANTGQVIDISNISLEPVN